MRLHVFDNPCHLGQPLHDSRLCDKRATRATNLNQIPNYKILDSPAYCHAVDLESCDEVILGWNLNSSRQGSVSNVGRKYRFDSDVKRLIGVP